MTAQPNRKDATIIVAGFLIALIVIVAIFAISESNAIYPHGAKTIRVTASGSMSESPGEAIIGMFVNGTGATSSMAVQNLSATMSKLNATIMRYVGNSSDIQTVSYSVGRVHNSTLYVARESIQVTVPKIKDTTALLVNSTNVPYTYVTSISASLTPSQAKALRSSAISAAMLNATTQAMAISTNVSLQNLSINNVYIYQPSGYEPVSALSVANAATVANSVFYGGMSSVTVSVSAEFAYK